MTSQVVTQFGEAATRTSSLAGVAIDNVAPTAKNLVIKAGSVAETGHAFARAGIEKASPMLQDAAALSASTLQTSASAIADRAIADSTIRVADDSGRVF